MSFLIKKKEIVIPIVVFETGDTKNILPNTVETVTGGEILPYVLKEQDREFLTYLRRNHTRSKRPTIPLVQGQSDTLSEESERNTGTLEIFSHNLVPNPDEISEPTVNLMLDVNSNDHDILIAIRKGKCSCTSHPMSNYLSCGKLLKKYNAYISNL